MDIRPTLSFRNALLLITVTALVPALVIIVLSGIEHGRTLEEAVRAESHRQVAAIAQVHTETVNSVQRLMETVAALNPFREGDRGIQLNVLTTLLEQDPGFINFSVTDRNGIVTVSPGLETGTDLSDRKHIQDALEVGRFITGEYVRARVGEIPAFPFALPLRDPAGEIAGVLATVYSLDAYDQLFDRLDLPEGAIVAIVDHEGTRIFYRPQSETNPVGSPIQAAAWEKINSGVDAGLFTLAGSDGVKRFYAFRRLSVPEENASIVYVVAGFPERLASGPSRRILLRNLLFMATVVAFAVAAALLLGDLVFARGFRTLVKTAGAISRGHLDARTNLPRGRSDIGMLAESVDRMAERLERREQENSRERELLNRSLKDKEVLLREIHHRVKNNMQMIMSLVNLQSDGTLDLESFRRNLEARIGAMATVHEMLYQSPDVASVAVAEFLERLVSVALQSASCVCIPPQIATDTIPVAIPVEQAVPLALITSELITNACKYGADDTGTVRIEIGLERREGTIVVTVRDYGPGIAGTSGSTGSGIGLKLVRSLCSQLRGEVHIETDNGEGTAVQVRFPEIS